MSCCNPCCKPKCCVQIIDTSPFIPVPEPKPELPPVEPPPPPPPPPVVVNQGTFISISDYSPDGVLIDGKYITGLDPIYDLGVVSIFYNHSEAVGNDEGYYSLIFSRENTHDKTVHIKFPEQLAEAPINSDVMIGDRELTIQDLLDGVTITFVNKPDDEYYSTKVYPTDEYDDFRRYYRYDVSYLDKNKYTLYIALDKAWVVNGVVATMLDLQGVKKVVTPTKVWLIPETKMVGSRYLEIVSTSDITFQDGEIGLREFTYGNTMYVRLSNPAQVDVLERVTPV